MPVEVETLLVKLEARITDFEKKMSQAESRASSAAKKIQGSFSGLGGVIGKSLGAIGVGLSVGAFAKIVKDGIEAGQAIGDLSEKLGITAEQLQELTFVAQQNGAGIEDVEAGFRGLTKFMGEASKGVQNNVNILHQLGLTFDDVKTKVPIDLFTELLDKIGKIGNPLQRNATLMAVFGKAGTQLAQVAALGASGIDGLRKKADDLGVVMSSSTVRALQDAGDQLDLLNAQWQTAEGRVAEGFLPALKSLTSFLASSGVQRGLESIASSISDFVKSTLTDINNLIAIAERVQAEFPGGNITGGLSNKDQPVPPGGPQGNSDAADRFIMQGGLKKLQQRFDEFSGTATPSSGKLTAAMIQASAASRALGKDASGVADAFETLGGEANKAKVPLTDAERAAERSAKKYQDESSQLALLGGNTGRTAREQFIFNELQQAGSDLSTTAGQALAQQAGHVFDLQQAYQQTIERMDAFRDAAKTGLSTFVGDLREGKSVLESLGDALDRITDRLIDFGLDQVVNALLGQSGSAGGGLLRSLFQGRASGGGASRNKPIVVGENGPEVFVPRTSGVIGHPGGGGGRSLVVETHYHNNAGVSVSERQTKTDKGLRLDVMIDDVVATKASDPSSKISRALAVRGLAPQTIRR